jgi:pimeloyl-ACP methyl ester carboxylesterase
VLLVTETVHDRIALALPDAEAQVVPGAGHLLPFEKPFDPARIIEDWLSRRTLMVGPGRLD